MQQRRPRLGDILDDYCPRERRITNHAVVAMIDDAVKRTRCTTCDAEHEYKHAKAPAPRRKKAVAALASVPVEAGRPRPATAAGEPDEDRTVEDNEMDTIEPAEESGIAAAPPDSPSDADADQAPAADALLEDEGPVHRPLIRATLPRPEGQVPERKEPDFTFRNQGGRGFDSTRNGHRQRGHRPARQAHGQNDGPRFGQPRHGSGQSNRQGAGQAPPRHGSGGGQGQRQGGNRPGPAGQRGGRPAGPGRGPRPGQGRGPKRGR